MGAVVEPLPVGYAVHPVEVQVLPEGQDEGENDEPDRVGAEGGEGDPAVAVGPQHQDFVERPDGAAADHGPEGVVLDLVPEQESLAIGARPAGVVLEASALDAPPVEYAVQRAGDDRQHNVVAREHGPDPLELQLAEVGQIVGAGLEVLPGRPAEQVVDSGAKGPEEAGEAEEEADQFAPFDGPGKRQGLAHGPGHPFATGIARLATVVERDGSRRSSFAVICHDFTLNVGIGAVKDLIR